MNYRGKIYDLLGYQKKEIKKLFLFIDTLDDDEWQSNSTISELLVYHGQQDLFQNTQDKVSELFCFTPRLLISWFVNIRLSIARKETNIMISDDNESVDLFNSISIGLIAHHDFHGTDLNESILNAKQKIFIVSNSIFSLFELYSQFKKGLTSLGGRVGKVYENYIMDSFNLSDLIAKNFYKEVRCSIVHSFCLGNAALGEHDQKFYCGQAEELHVYDLKVFYDKLINDIQDLITSIEEDSNQAKQSFKKLKSMYL